MKSFKEISKGMLSEGGEMYPADEMTMKEIKIACYAARNILERLEDGAMIQRWQISAIVKASDELASVYTSMSADEGMKDDEDDMMDDEEDDMSYNEYGYPSMYEETGLDEASSIKVEIPKSRYETILKVHGPGARNSTSGVVVRSPKDTMKYKGASHLDFDKATNSSITQTYSHDDHGIATIEVHTNKDTGNKTYHMHKKAKKEEVELDEVFTDDYKGMLGSFKKAIEKAEAAHKRGDDKAKADNIENARMRLRGMKNTDIAKLKNSAHYDRFKKLKEDMDYSVEIEGLPKMYVKGKSPMDVKAILRKIVKKPDMIQNVERTTKSELRKAFMLKAQGKDENEDV